MIQYTYSQSIILNIIIMFIVKNLTFLIVPLYVLTLPLNESIDWLEFPINILVILNLQSLWTIYNHEENIYLNKLFRFEESLEMFHLPDTHSDEEEELPHGPIKNSRICRFGCLSESFFAISLIILLLCNLLCLWKELSNTHLQVWEFLFLGDRSIIDGMFAHLQIQMDSQLATGKPLRWVRVETDWVFTRWMWSERESTLWWIDLEHRKKSVTVDSYNFSTNHRLSVCLTAY